MVKIRSGRRENYPYSLSRWTDLPAAKWDWFLARLDAGHFLGVDPKTGIPAMWSIKPEDTLGMIFWTREPSNLIRIADRLKAYSLAIHLTLTGWHEVEHKAPDLERGLSLLTQTAETFGPENVIWRFSPVPLVDDVVERFARIAEVAEKTGIRDVFISFLQENDKVPETRPPRVRAELLKQMAARTTLNVKLCNEDVAPLFSDNRPSNLMRGVCEDGGRFIPKPGDPRFSGPALPPAEGCGCALAVDPFTINETCVFGCEYCYAADKSLAPKKRNTTKNIKRLPLL